jgi:hypothetical protein
VPRDSAGHPGYGGCPAAPACPPAVWGAASDAAGTTPAWRHLSDGDRIAEITGFVAAEVLSRWGEDGRFVGATVFPRFGLPAVLPG